MEREQLERIQQLSTQVERQEREDVYAKVDVSTAFGDLESMLFRGFLTSVANVGGRVRILLKSLTQAEIRMANFYSETVDGTDQDARNRYLLASAVFMLDGTNVLAQRDALGEVVTALASLTGDMQTLLLLRVIQLMERGQKCLHQVAGYCWHPLSRQRWRTLRNIPMNSPAYTGIPGTERIGFNQCQEVWIAVNQMEDERIDRETQWENAKFVASAWAGKAMRSVNAKDRTRLRGIEMEREHAFLKAAGIDTSPGETGHRVSAETTEELMDQLNRAVRGEKDLHDLIVEKHERQMRKEYDNRIADLKRLRESVPDYDGFLTQSVEVFDPAAIGPHLRRLQADREERRRQRVRTMAGQVTGAKRMEILSRLTPPKVLQVSQAPLVEDLTVRMSPDEATNYVRPDGLDAPIRDGEGD